MQFSRVTRQGTGARGDGRASVFSHRSGTTVPAGRHQVPRGQRATHQPVRHHGQGARRRRRAPYQLPRAVHPGMEHLPALAVGRRVGRREHVEVDSA